MSLANIQGKLSRTEMKNIMAGSGGCSGPGCCVLVGQQCSTSRPCCQNLGLQCLHVGPNNCKCVTI